MRHSFRFLPLVLALGGLLATPLNASAAPQATLAPLPAVAASTQDKVRIIASLPITYGLAQLLLKGTDVTLERAAPANLPGSRQTAYFTGRGATELHTLAATADAAIGIRSIWSDDPLYPNARRSNIRIVEIDAARPVDGALPGIALQSGKNDGLTSQPWQSSNNLGRMGDGLAADLVRLAPGAKAQIDANLAALKQSLLKTSASAEAQLAKADNLSVVSLSDHFAYLISGLNLELLETDARADNEWTPESLAQLQNKLKDNDVAVVLHHRQPSDAVKGAIEAGGSQLLVLETDSADPLAELEGNIGKVVGALVKRS